MIALAGEGLDLSVQKYCGGDLKSNRLVGWIRALMRSMMTVL